MAVDIPPGLDRDTQELAKIHHATLWGAPSKFAFRLREALG